MTMSTSIAAFQLLDLCLHALPVESPEHVRPMRQNNGFRESDFGSAERLAYTVGFAHRIGINQRDIQASGMAECQKRLMEVRKAGGDGAAVSATADDQDANRPLAQTAADRVYGSSLLRLQFSQVVLYGFRFDECRKWETLLPGQALPQGSGTALSGG